jgi:alanine-glyoxylate transaminase/serine-glyoxylate transaminase/serine-pyruvate transaminase
MDDVREGLKYVFQTKNKLTFAVSGTGHAGMECALLNLLEQGEKILVIRNGLWGERAASLSKRLNFNVQTLSVPDGQVAKLDEFKQVNSLSLTSIDSFHRRSTTSSQQPYSFVTENLQLGCCIR